MTFRPAPGDTLEINHFSFGFTASPIIPVEVFHIVGPVATIYQLSDPRGKLFNLKGFPLAYCIPRHQVQVEAMATCTNLLGMSTVQRIMIVSIDHAELVIRYTEKHYAVPMSWLEGQTWASLMPSWTDTPHQQCFQAARSLADLLIAKEQRGIAHRNLCAANALVKGGTVHLKDLDDMVLPDTAP